MRSKLCCHIALIFLFACRGELWSQNESASHLYGRGAHAYYRGNLSDARQHLDQSIAFGSKDPRAYYFRGLTKLRSGDSYGAEADFNTAATLEYAGQGNYDIGMSLARIQGTNRVTLERVRRATRDAIRSAPKTEPVRPIEPSVPRVAPQPYDEFDEAPLKKDHLPPVQELPADRDDPFGDDPLEKDQPDDGGDTFGDGFDNPALGGSTNNGNVVLSVMRALFNVGGKILPSPQVNLRLPGGNPSSVAPFGDEAPAADGLFGDDGTGEDGTGDDGDDANGFDSPTDDPFGEQPTNEPADNEPFGVEPFGVEPAPASEDDLFGDDPLPADLPADPEPMDEGNPFGDDGGDAPAGEDDPFGDDGGAAPAGENDPFGERDPLGDDGANNGAEAATGEPDPFGDLFGEEPEDGTPAGDDDPFGV